MAISQARPKSELREGQLFSYDPATLELVGSVPATEPEAVPEVAAEARAVARSWRQSSFEERRRLLERTMEVILDRIDEIAALVSRENGKPRAEAYVTDVFALLGNIDWLARNAGRVLRSERIRFRQPHLWMKQGALVREPYGVAAVIAPWNYPFLISMSDVAAAVAAGNAVVLKPAEQTPLVGALVEEVFADADAPAGLVRVVQGLGETVGQALVGAPAVGTILLTGSTEVGRQVAARAGERLKPVRLELGGNDAIVVLADADLDRAVAGVLWNGMQNCGQTCAGGERVFVARELYEPFVEELSSRARALRLGHGLDLRTELGPLISARRRDRVANLVNEAVARGARVRTGGEAADVGLPGAFYLPTILTDVAADAAVQQEETFGPILTVTPFSDEREGVRLANDCRYGLGASVWSRDVGRARALARQIEAGMVWINDHVYSFGTEAPWGGLKESGFGTAHGPDGLRSLTRLRYLDSDSGRIPVPWWFPYGAGYGPAFRAAARVLYTPGLGRRAVAAARSLPGLVALGRRYLGR